MGQNFHDVHFRDLKAAIHPRYRLASSCNLPTAGSISCAAFSSQSAAFFSSSAIVGSTGTIFMIDTLCHYRRC
jgi:hypothetical protein